MSMWMFESVYTYLQIYESVVCVIIYYVYFVYVREYVKSRVSFPIIPIHVCDDGTFCYH